MRRFILVALVILAASLACILVPQPSEAPTETPPILEVVEPEESVSEIIARRRAQQEVEEQERREASLAESKAAWAEVAERAAVNEARAKQRKLRRFVWEAPADDRGSAWNVPEEETEASVLTAFLRICIAEADGAPQDCVGIWQVMRNIRRRACERGAVRRITECDEDGETILSVMRRSQRHILGNMPLRNKRAGWIRNLDTSCDVPEAWTGSEDQWVARNEGRCQHAVKLGRALLAGHDLATVSRPGHRLSWLPGRPITWGGRCETRRASCDDRIACSRGLTRIDSGPTHNAFWGRPRNEGEIDPVCQAMGYGHLVENETEAEEEG